jgi:hypothetical protein
MIKNKNKTDDRQLFFVLYNGCQNATGLHLNLDNYTDVVVLGNLEDADLDGYTDGCGSLITRMWSSWGTWKTPILMVTRVGGSLGYTLRL